MKTDLLISLLCVAVSCSGAATADMPAWRWEDPQPPVEEPFQDPWPAMIEKGWTNVTEALLGSHGDIEIYRSPDTIDGNRTVAYVAAASLSVVKWDVRSIDDPSIQGTTDALRTPSDWYAEGAVPVLVNGGYFFSEGGKNYNASVAVSAGRTYGVNINYASLDWETMYYPTRGVFYQDEGAAPAVGWTYWSGGARHYLYDAPAENSWEAAPLQVPDAGFPVKGRDFAPQTAIGGGPVLLKDGEIVNSWQAELLYGDGADDKMPKARHPRTAIGYTGDGRLVLFVCEGRGMTDGVAGMTFAEEAALLKDLGCTDALNLDGGGSSCLLAAGKETIKPSDGKQRAVSSVIVLQSK